jgi:hypothetical protein
VRGSGKSNGAGAEDGDGKGGIGLVHGGSPVPYSLFVIRRNKNKPLVIKLSNYFDNIRSVHGNPV